MLFTDLAVGVFATAADVAVFVVVGGGGIVQLPLHV